MKLPHNTVSTPALAQEGLLRRGTCIGSEGGSTSSQGAVGGEIVDFIECWLHVSPDSGSGR